MEDITTFSFLKRQLNERHFWIFFPFILLFTTFNFTHSSFPVYFPFIVGLCVSAIFFFRTYGFCLAILLLLPFYKNSIWEMTLLYTFIVEFFITLLSFEEAHSLKNEIETSPNEITNVGWENERKAFEEEIERLKEEAKRRYLEMTLLEETIRNKEIASQVGDEETIRNKEIAPQVGDEEIKRMLAKLEGQYKQLRSQFEEKSHVLTNTRKELFHTQGKLLAYEKEKSFQRLEDQGDEDLLIKELISAYSELECMQEELVHLEALVTNI